MDKVSKGASSENYQLYCRRCNLETSFSCLSNTRDFTVVCFAFYLKLLNRKEIVADHSARTSIDSMKLELVSVLRKHFDYTCIPYIVLSCKSV